VKISKIGDHSGWRPVTGDETEGELVTLRRANMQAKQVPSMKSMLEYTFHASPHVLPFTVVCSHRIFPYLSDDLSFTLQSQLQSLFC